MSVNRTAALEAEVTAGVHEIWVEAVSGVERFYAGSDQPNASEIVDLAIRLQELLGKAVVRLNGMSHG